MKPNTRIVVALFLVATISATAVVAAARPALPADARQVESVPDIEVQPETLRFVDTTDGPTARTLTVRNVGDAPLTIRSVRIVGPDRAAFGVGAEAPGTLAPGERETVTVTFDPAESRPRFATIHVLSDDPDEPQRNVWLTNTRTIADVSPSRVLETKTLVNATVTNVEANTTQSLNLSWPLTRDDGVAIDALSFTPERDGSVALSVATNASRFADVPAFAPADGTEPVGFVRVEHDLDDDHVRNVTFTFRVRRDLLTGTETGPEDVSLYRFEEGVWVERPTRLVDEGNTHYFFEASAPGLSDFATGIKQAQFRITDALVTVTRLTTAEGTEVLVRVRNVGGADGTYTVRLLLADTVVDSRELSIAPNGTRQATFERSFDEPGTYQVSVNDRFVGHVTVDPAATAAPTTATAAATDGAMSRTRSGAARSTTDGALPGFGPGTATLALLVATLLLVVHRRRR
jgi:hypothetical protein